MPRLVPLLISEKALAQSAPSIFRCTASLKGVHAKPALDVARNTPAARMMTFGAIATVASPTLAAARPKSTGAAGPCRDSIHCAASKPMKNLVKPRLDTKPTVDVDIENAERKSGTNRPKPIRAGPKLMAVATKPAAERLV